MITIFKNIYSKEPNYVTLEYGLNRIREGKSRLSVVEIRNTIDKEKSANLKKNLPSVCFSGKFGAERKDSDLILHSGYIVLDFDNIFELRDRQTEIISNKFVYACWVSPSGNGLKALIKIADGSKHREHFQALQDIFPAIDKSGVNPSRVCYESYDPDMHLNEASEVWTEALKIEIVSEVKTYANHDNYKKLVKWMETRGRLFESGNRNFFVFVLAGAMCRYGFGQEDAEQILVSDYSNGSDFNAKEIIHSVGSAFKKNKQLQGTVEFTGETLSLKETSMEISPKIFEEGFKLEDIIYGSDVYEGAVDIYENGYTSAETTRILKLDEFFKWKRGEITLLGGIGNYGKSHYFSFLQLVKSYFDGTKWAVFSPENYPAHEYFLDLTEMLLGCCCYGHGKPGRQIFNEAYEFVSKHFFYVYPEMLSPTPEYVKKKFMELILKEGVSGCCIDPFNQMDNEYAKAGGRSDKYLETFLSDCKRFAQQNNLYFSLIAHPTKLKKEPSGNYPCPDVFDLAGGAMWNNKVENMLVYHRPYAQTDPENAACEHHSKKIRRGKTVGKKGFFEFTLNRKKRRFYFNDFCPLEGNKYDLP